MFSIPTSIFNEFFNIRNKFLYSRNNLSTVWNKINIACFYLIFFQIMVCIMEEDESAFCVVRDFSGTSQDWKVETLVTASTTGKQFLRDIADRYNFEPESFRLVSPTPFKKNNIYQVSSTCAFSSFVKNSSYLYHR